MVKEMEDRWGTHMRVDYHRRASHRRWASTWTKAIEVEIGWEQASLPKDRDAGL
jgi:hypothetical protein